MDMTSYVYQQKLTNTIIKQKQYSII